MQTQYSHGTQDYEYDQDSQMEYGRGEKSSNRTSTRRPKYSRLGARPAVCNGIHRRRNKRWSW